MATVGEKSVGERIPLMLQEVVTKRLFKGFSCNMRWLKIYSFLSSRFPEYPVSATLSLQIHIFGSVTFSQRERHSFPKKYKRLSVNVL
jgi:hypothetical protein